MTRRDGRCRPAPLLLCHALGMDTLTRANTWLLRPRLVGTPLHWASHAGALGAALGALSPLALLLPTKIVPSLYETAGYSLISSLVGGSIGAGLGLLVPGLLDRVRGRVPLPPVVLMASGTGTLAGALSGYSWWWASFAAHQYLLSLDLSPLFVVFGAVIGAVAATLWWLPLTVAIVVERRWPVTAAVGIGLPVAILFWRFCWLG